MRPCVPIQIQIRAATVFEDAGLRCCSVAEFTLWFAGSEEMHEPSTVRSFCLECPAWAREELAAAGRCMRMDGPDPAARERMKRWRDRQKLALATAAS